MKVLYIPILLISILFAYLTGRLHEIALTPDSDASQIQTLLAKGKDFYLFQEYHLYPSAEGKNRWYYRSVKKGKSQADHVRHKK